MSSYLATLVWFLTCDRTVIVEFSEAPIWNRIPSYEKGVTFSSSVIDAAVDDV